MTKENKSEIEITTEREIKKAARVAQKRKLLKEKEKENMKRKKEDE